MKLALQIYGELRTFEKSIPTLLHFLSYKNRDFDVFLLIDRSGMRGHNPNNKNNYSEANILKLKNLLGESNIKKLIFYDELDNYHENEEKEKKLANNVLSLWNKVNSVYGHIIHWPFVCNLFNRYYILNNIRKEYEKKNNITYDYVIRTRFDFGTTYDKPFVFNENTTPVMCSDALIIGNPEFMNHVCNATFNFPLIPKVFFDENGRFIQGEKYEKYKNWRGDKFWQPQWIFAPELNLRLELLEKNIHFIEAWWLEPCNYGFKLIR